MNHLHTTVVDNVEELARLGADYILQELRRRPDMLMCVATGSSPLGTYRSLAFHFRQEPETFGRLRVIKLDEWGPLAADDPASCEHYVRREVVEPLQIAADRYWTVRGDAVDAEAECRRYAEVLERIGPVDVAVLGMGTNGHLGLNEPAEWLRDSVHVAELAPDSQGHGMLKTARTRPTHGLTMGMGDILRSRRILLIVNGASKRDALRRFMAREISTRFPASLLWTHGDVTLLCDREAFPEPR